MPEREAPAADNSLVTPIQIARLADVGRAAVSNWRRRYPDFPQPAGGTANSPLFELSEVEAWLRSNGRITSGSAAESRLHQDMMTPADLADVVNYLAGQYLLGESRLKTSTDDLLRDRPAIEVAQRLVEREAARARAAGDFGPMPVIADVIASLLPDLGPDHPALVADPHCGLGSLLPALARHLGSRQTYVAHDPSPANTRVTTGLLALAGCEDVHGKAFDALAERPPHPADPAADVVACAVPVSRPASGEPTWSATDPRWVFGVPPQGMPELAWVQHCYSLVRPGGTCALVILSNASTHPLGRHIRGLMVKSRALTTVMTLPPGSVPGTARAVQIWLLRRPEAGTPASRSVRMIDASEFDAAALTSAITGRWRSVAEDPYIARDVPLIDLLEGNVDLLPARWLTPPVRDVVEPFQAARSELVGLLRSLQKAVPDLTAASQLTVTDETDTLTVGALARSGALEILPAGTTTAFDDILVNAIDLDRSKIVADPASIGHPAKMSVLRCDPDEIDPYFLLGHLRSSANRRLTGTLSSRNDVRRARIPRLGIEEQRDLGQSVKTLVGFAIVSARARTLSSELTALAFDGLTTGVLAPQPSAAPASADGPRSVGNPPQEGQHVA